MSKIALALCLFLCPFAYSEQLKLTPANTVLIRGEINDASVSKAMNDLSVLNKKRQLGSTIYLVLDTPGGDIESGETLISYLKSVPKVSTVTIFAASMGSAIVEALPGTRYITDDGTLMFHRAKAGLSGQIEMGEVESRLTWIKSIVLRMEKRNAKRMNMSLQAYKAKVKDEYWLDSGQSIATNAADKVVDIVCSQSLIEATDELHIESMFGSYTVSFSQCPLFRFPLSIARAKTTTK